MLQPKKRKYRKEFRGKMRGKAQRGSTIAFGQYAIKALAAGWLTSRQIEAARRALTHYTKRGGRIWIRIFPDQPLTKKPPEVTMGAGKGDPVGYVAVVRPGRIIFEIDGVARQVAEEALRHAAQKLPVRTKIVSR